MTPAGPHLWCDLSPIKYIYVSISPADKKPNRGCGTCASGKRGTGHGSSSGAGKHVGLLNRQRADAFEESNTSPTVGDWHEYGTHHGWYRVCSGEVDFRRGRGRLAGALLGDRDRLEDEGLVDDDPRIYFVLLSDDKRSLGSGGLDWGRRIVVCRLCWSQRSDGGRRHDRRLRRPDMVVDALEILGTDTRTEIPTRVQIGIEAVDQLLLGYAEILVDET